MECHGKLMMMIHSDHFKWINGALLNTKAHVAI